MTPASQTQVQTDEQRPSMGVLDLRSGESAFELTRTPPAEELGFFVRHYWSVRWDLTGQEPYTQHVVPNPCVNLVIEPGKSGIFAPAKHKFSYFLHGKGIVFGVKFKPGGFYPFLRRSVAELAESPLRVNQLLDTDDRELEQLMTETGDPRLMAETLDHLLLAKLPAQDSNVLLINEIIDWIGANHELAKVESVCEQFGLNMRKLQRLFDQYVGTSPKWTIRLHRLQNAAARMDSGERLDWTALSAELGYYDQSHFIRDFKTVVGNTPEEYAREVARRRLAAQEAAE